MSEETESSLTTLLDEAALYYQQAHYDQAAEQYKLLGEAYRSLEDSLRAAEMDNNCSVALLQAGRAREALQVVLGTDQLFAAAGDVRRQAMALGNIAAAHEELKQYDRAYELYEQSAELLKEVDEPDLRSYTLQRLSGLKLRRKEPFEAMSNIRTAVESRKKLTFKDKVLKFMMDRFFGPRPQ